LVDLDTTEETDGRDRHDGEDRRREREHGLHDGFMLAA